MHDQERIISDTALDQGEINLSSSAECEGKFCVLILISDTGGGHRASAVALSDAINKLYPNLCSIHVVDIWTDYGVWPFNTFVPAYKYLCNNPQYWKMLYDSTKSQMSRDFINNTGYMLCGSRFKELIITLNPSIICSLHPLCQHIPLKLLREIELEGSNALCDCKNEWVELNRVDSKTTSSTPQSYLKYLKKKINNTSCNSQIVKPNNMNSQSEDTSKTNYKLMSKSKSMSLRNNHLGQIKKIPVANYNLIANAKKKSLQRTPFVTVITDFGGAHPTWFSPDVDICFAPSEIVRDLGLSEGLKSEQIRVYGLPIKKEFWSDSTLCKLSVREKLGLEKNSRTCLIIGGGEGVGDIEAVTSSVVKALLRCKSTFNYQVVIICGNNYILKKRLEYKFRNLIRDPSVKGCIPPLIDSAVDTEQPEYTRENSTYQTNRNILKQISTNTYNTLCQNLFDIYDISGSSKNSFPKYRDSNSNILRLKKSYSYSDMTNIQSIFDPFLSSSEASESYTKPIQYNNKKNYSYSDISNFSPIVSSLSNIYKNPNKRQDTLLYKKSRSYSYLNEYGSFNFDTLRHDSMKYDLKSNHENHVEISFEPKQTNENRKYASRKISSSNGYSKNISNFLLNFPNYKHKLNLLNSFMYSIDTDMFQNIPHIFNSTKGTHDTTECNPSETNNRKSKSSSSWTWSLRDFPDFKKKKSDLLDNSRKNSASSLYLVNEIGKSKNRMSVYIQSFITNMEEWMTASDIVLTKAGPGTIAEACARSLPIVLFFYLPGQEEGNVKFVIEKKMGLYCESAEKIGSVVLKLFNNPDLLQTFSNNAKSAGNSQATCEIARDIIELMLNVKKSEN